jgi:hypothetical protein
MAAAAGASTREVMARGGWSSPQMALRYEHATEERDRFIAQALGSFAAVAVPFPNGSVAEDFRHEDRARSRTQRARSRTQRARHQNGVHREISESGADQEFPAKLVRPSGFEPETCGVTFRRSHLFAGVRNCAPVLDLSFARVRMRSQAFTLRGSPIGS